MSTSNSIYGRHPGVKITVTGGGISNARIGREQKLVLFGHGDTSGEADPNDPTQIRSRVDAGQLFGSGTQLAEGIEKALENKGSRNYIYGVALEETTADSEPITGGSGILENAPLLEDISEIEAEKTNTPDEYAEVEFRYESPPPTPSDGPTVYINPLTGEVEADDDTDYDITYVYGDWQAALDSADQVLKHAEVGIYAPLTDSEDVAVMLSEKLSGVDGDNNDRGLRGEYKLATGVIGAQPNMTTDNGDAAINVDEFDHPVDDDAVFMAGPVRRSGEDSTRTIVAGIAGLFAGNALENPVYGDSISGYGSLSQELTRDEQALLRDLFTIPVVDDYRDGEEGISIQGHRSTSSADDWDRTFQNRRLTDLVILMQRRIGEAARDNLMRDQQLRTIETQIISGFERLARAGLIHGDPDGRNRAGTDSFLEGLPQDVGGEDDSTPYFVEAVRSDVNTIQVSSGFTPIGVTTAIDGYITVSDSVDAFASTEEDGGDN